MGEVAEGDWEGSKVGRTEKESSSPALTDIYCVCALCMCVYVYMCVCSLYTVMSCLHFIPTLWCQVVWRSDHT